MSLFICLAFPPLAIYLLAIGLINLRRKALVVSGVRDINYLGLALSGFAIAGPLELFLPEMAAFRFGPWVWLLMLALYVLIVVLWSLMAAPRLVVYNARLEQIRPLISEIARELDPDSRWAAESLVVPKLGLRMHLEPSHRLKCVQMVATGSQQDYEGWRQFERHVRKRLRLLESARNPHGLWAIFASGLLLTITTVTWIRDFPDLLAQLHDLLRT